MNTLYDGSVIVSKVF